MRAGRVLQELLASCWASLDQRLVRRVLGAIEAMVDARQVVLMELARQYPGATHTAAPLKALDRLLSNPRVQALRPSLYRAALARLWPVSKAVVVIVDWCTLTRDESLHLLRAAMPVGGRALPVWDEVHQQAKLGNASVHDRFLASLRALVPANRQPIVITDAGFSVPWFRSAQARGFACIGRLRGRTVLRPKGEEEWAPIKAFEALRMGQLVDLGRCEISKRHRHPARVVVYKVRVQGVGIPAASRPVPGGADRRRSESSGEKPLAND